MHTLHLSRRAALACSLAVLASAPVVAQEASYPSKPITIVVGYPPGGSTDLTGRVVATELGNRLGVPVVIENIGGAGGAIGAQKVASAAPDSKPNRLMAAATASSKKLDAPISAEGQATLCFSPTARLSQYASPALKNTWMRMGTASKAMTSGWLRMA